MTESPHGSVAFLPRLISYTKQLCTQIHYIEHVVITACKKACSFLASIVIRKLQNKYARRQCITYWNKCCHAISKERFLRSVSQTSWTGSTCGRRFGDFVVLVSIFFRLFVTTYSLHPLLSATPREKGKCSDLCEMETYQRMNERRKFNPTVKLLVHQTKIFGLSHLKAINWGVWSVTFRRCVPMGSKVPQNGQTIPWPPCLDCGSHLRLHVIMMCSQQTRRTLWTQGSFPIWALSMPTTWNYGKSRPYGVILTDFYRSHNGRIRSFCPHICQDECYIHSVCPTSDSGQNIAPHARYKSCKISWAKAQVSKTSDTICHAMRKQKSEKELISNEKSEQSTVLLFVRAIFLEIRLVISSRDGNFKENLKKNQVLGQVKWHASKSVSPSSINMYCVSRVVCILFAFWDSYIWVWAHTSWRSFRVSSTWSSLTPSSLTESCTTSCSSQCSALSKSSFGIKKWHNYNPN